jgi:glycosyltransferase involved in cell wall biosynthesis
MELAHAYPKTVRLVLLRRNFGQTAAMQAGIQHSRCDYIVTMDGDLQNDPDSIPLMLSKLDGGYDLVHGWRKSRQDKLMSRKLPSWLANRLISKVTGFPINDLGCTLKAIKSEVAKDLELYGEMHRFIPILAWNLGARCIEIEVNHRSRIHGESKYGIGRISRVLLDLITVKYMTNYFSSPMKFFGMFGFIVSAVALMAGVAVVLMKLFWDFDITGNPLLYLGIVTAILSLQLFSMGLIGELSVRIYYATGEKTSYQVRRLVNFGSENRSDEARVKPSPDRRNRVEEESSMY